MISNTVFKCESHVFEMNQRHVLFDVLRGGFFEIDDVTRDVLAVGSGHTSEEIFKLLLGSHPADEIRSAIEELERAEILSPKPVQIAPFHPPSRVEISHLSLCVTTDSIKADRSTGPQYMSEGVALGAMDFLMQESGLLEDCMISFEGGDPLLNFPLIRRIIEYGEGQAASLGKKVHFELVTDGSGLTERNLTYIYDKGVCLIVEFCGDLDQDSLDRIASVVETGHQSGELRLQIVANGRDMDLRGRVDELKRRFPFARGIGVRWESLPAQHPDHIQVEQIQDVRNNLGVLRDYTIDHLVSRDEMVLEEIEGPIAQLMGRHVLLYSCGAGTRSIAVSPQGGLYPCSDLLGWDSLEMGDVFSGIDREQYRSWLQDLHVERREPCRNCWARYQCGGGCCADAVMATGDASKPNPTSCERIRYTNELAMCACLEGDEQDPGLLESRYPSAHPLSEEVRISDEHPVLERYA